MKLHGIVRKVLTIWSLPCALMVGLVAAPLAIKAAESLLSFTNGDVIDADKMNNNFTYLDDQLSSLDNRVSEYEDTLSVDPSTISVGIGTASPAVRLDVKQSSQSPLQGIRALDSSGTVGAFLWSDGSSARLSGCSDDSCKVVINGSGSGNVGIGTTNPTAQLHIRNSSSAAAITLESGGAYSGTIRAVGGDGKLDFYTSDNRRMRIDANGYVAIGANTPYYALDVNGYVRATNVSVTSDVRLKTDIAVQAVCIKLP